MTRDGEAERAARQKQTAEKRDMKLWIGSSSGTGQDTHIVFFKQETRVSRHDRQSPMKNLEVKFSLSELEFRCKNLFLIWEKHWEARI